ncbi:MAG: hypothetical protein AAF919_13795 [Pseudomonadota bacterium]
MLVLLTVLIPSLLMPEPNPQITDAMVLVAIFAAIFTSVEYGAVYPGLVEFRAAPPFNRVRFGTLAVMLVLITLAVGDRPDPSSLSRLFAAVGNLLGQSLDLPFSPIRLVLWLLPEGTRLSDAHDVRTAAGLAYLIALVGLTIFSILIRLHSWPAPSGAFNVWINLPTFDPTAGADVVTRLKRDGAVNILLGILLPYLTPPIAAYIGRSNGISMFDSDLMLVWTISLWAFLPASLFLRGIAMRRLALMISMKRRRFEAESGLEDPAFLPA